MARIRRKRRIVYVAGRKITDKATCVSHVAVRNYADNSVYCAYCGKTLEEGKSNDEG